MSLAGGLNLIWVSAAIIALAVLVSRERHRRSRLRDRCRRGFAVFVAAVALFPCISASDDLVRFGQMQANPSTATETAGAAPDASGDAHTVHLARLLQVLESFQLSAAAWLLMTLCFCTLALVASKLGPERNTPTPSSRAPPAFAFLG